MSNIDIQWWGSSSYQTGLGRNKFIGKKVLL
jgi:hypothetical protein